MIKTGSLAYGLMVYSWQISKTKFYFKFYLIFYAGPTISSPVSYLNIELFPLKRGSNRFQNKFAARKHSSRMHTARLETIRVSISVVTTDDKKESWLSIVYRSIPSTLTLILLQTRTEKRIIFRRSLNTFVEHESLYSRFRSAFTHTCFGISLTFLILSHSAKQCPPDIGLPDLWIFYPLQ